MAALAYLAPPVSGAFAFLFGDDPRVRFHGLQSVVIGVLWPVLLYGASAVSPTATRVVFAFGLIVWIGSGTISAFGRDARLPIIGRLLARSAGLAGG